MKSKNKIFLITECPYSGILRAIIEDAVYLNKLGHEINFLVPIEKRDRYGESSRDNIEMLNKIGKVSYLHLRRKYLYILLDMLSLEKFLEEKKKYIIFSYGSYAGKLCRLLYKKGVIKELYHVPQCVDIVRKKFLTRIIEYIFEKSLAPYSKFYLACSLSEKNMLIKKYKINRNKILLNPNSIRKNFANTKKGKRYKYIFIGRIVKSKGIHEVLEAIYMIGASNDLLVIGDGSELKFLKSKYPKVKFLGFVPNKKIFEYLRHSEFILSNSIIEGSPFSIIEAMFCGVIPILSKVDGHEDLVLDGYNGFLFNGKKELINTLFDIQSISKNRRKAISIAAINTVYKLRNLKKEFMFGHFAIQS